MTERRMSMREAMEIVDDDLPDGAYWAMCHEIAGLDYGDGFDELAGIEPGRYLTPGAQQGAAFKVSKKLRAKIEAFGELRNNDRYHWQVRKDGRVVADWWPHKRQWRLAGGAMARGDEKAFVKALAGHP